MTDEVFKSIEEHGHRIKDEELQAFQDKLWFVDKPGYLAFCSMWRTCLKTQMIMVKVCKKQMKLADDDQAGAQSERERMRVYGHNLFIVRKLSKQRAAAQYQLTRQKKDQEPVTR
jgi:hypothetical protein